MARQQKPNGKAGRGRKAKNAGQGKLSWTVKPGKMTQEEWQTALRRQLAQEEAFGIECVDERLCPGEYTVQSPKTKQEYKVVFRGEGSRWNYCSCFDFKTSQLGTCKHIEAVSQWIAASRKRRVYRQIPPYTSVYLSYKGERRVCIRIGSDHRQEFEQLAARYFDRDGVMLDTSFQDIEAFTKEAVAISDTFRFYRDAVDFIIDRRETGYRRKILQKYSDQDLDKLLTVTLYPYQKEGIRFAFAKGRSIIADEMGLGKTIQAIGTAELMRREKLIQSVLIVCPTSLKYQWKREIERFTGQSVHVIEGALVKRLEQYKLDLPYKIVSYNSACNDIKATGKLQTDLLIMDEVQRLKNWNTQISIAMRKVESPYAVILSGTPLENKLEELYSVMEFADQYCLAPFWKFKADCIVSDETGKVVGYRNLNRIGEKTRERLIRRTKKQVALQMPSRQDKNLFVPMTKEQREAHDELKYIVAQIIMKWRRMHFLTEKDRNRLLLCLSQMRMLCDSTYILDQKSRHDTKVDEALNIILSLVESDGEKVVVFSQWERMTRLVAQELEARGVGFEYLHGGVPSAERGKLISNFADNPDSRVFLSTDAGSTGLNLQSAATIINLDLPWNPAVLEQRIARIYRLGQQRSVQVINLVSADTIEEQMLDKLRFKLAMFEGVLDNGQDSIFLGDNSRLTQMMETLSGIVEEERSESAPQQEPAGETPSADSVEATENAGQTVIDFPPVGSSSPAAVVTDTESPREENTQSKRPSEMSDEPTSGGMDENPSDSSNGGISEVRISSSPNDLITTGTAFLSGLAATLKSREATEQLIDTLIVTDEKTGKTSLNIPVPDKQSVRNLLDVIGKLFG